MKNKESYIEELTQLYSLNEILFLDIETLDSCLTTIFNNLGEEEANQWLNNSNRYLGKSPIEELKQGGNNPKLSIESVSNAFKQLIS